MINDKATHERALEAYRQHTGKDYVTRGSPHDPANIKDLATLGFDRTYGDSWSRPGLDMRTKSFVCMTLTAALGCEDQLKSHVTAAHHTGITKEEVVEWLIHLNGYLGTPRTNVALKCVREVWAAMAAK